MKRQIKAELMRFMRRKPMMMAALGATVFAVVATFAVFASAGTTPQGRGGLTVNDLTAHGGGTEAFAVGASFAGFVVFVIFIAAIASEFSGGTMRALLLRNPNRLAVVTGKLAGLLIVAGAVVLTAEVISFGLSLVAAQVNDVSSADWFGVDSLGAAASNFAAVMAGVIGWASFGTALGVAFRSAPIALGVGFAWAGPFENIIVDSVDAGYRYFPGLVLGSITQGGTDQLDFGRGLLTATIYAAIAALIAFTLMNRKDVTA